MSIKNLFRYEPKKEYDFTIQPTQNASTNQLEQDDTKQTIYDSIEKNLKYIESQYIIDFSMVWQCIMIICTNDSVLLCEI